MSQTFANLPSYINRTVSDLLSNSKDLSWNIKAVELHNRYMARDKKIGNYVNDQNDVLAYLALRFSATYAQIYGALSQLQELQPSWHPQSVLDIGSGPGTGIWASIETWPSIATATAIEQNPHFLSVGQNILGSSPSSIKVTWQQQDFTKKVMNNNEKFDLVILANVLNELTPETQLKIVNQAYSLCNGVVVIIESGTSNGVKIIEHIGQEYSDGNKLLAPYVNGIFIRNNSEWIHFAQRFKRPEFLRQLRQYMRSSSLMASDWEEAKYAYIAITKNPFVQKFYGRLIGPVKKLKGYLQYTLLTEKKIEKVKIPKHNKAEYIPAKDFKWGQIIPTK